MLLLLSLKLHLKVLCLPHLGCRSLGMVVLNSQSVGGLACGTKLANCAVVAQLLGRAHLEIVRLLNEILVYNMLDHNRFDLGV